MLTVKKSETYAMGGATYGVTSANAFTGANVGKLAAKVFNGSKVTAVVLKTKGLTKVASVKNCFSGSKVATVQVKAGTAAANKKLVATYKKVFTKKNTGTSAKTLTVK